MPLAESLLCVLSAGLAVPLGAPGNLVLQLLRRRRELGNIFPPDRQVHIGG
jgi:hypothetical protein